MTAIKFAKTKIYLDTSVISYLEQDDAPERRDKTRKLWELLKQGRYEVYISDVVLKEIADCSMPKRELLQNRLREIDYHLIEPSEEGLTLAEKIIDYEILKRKSYDDCRHIAAAMLANCDTIVSWNFKHIVNFKTIRGIKIVAMAEGYREVSIYPPDVFLDYEED